MEIELGNTNARKHSVFHALCPRILATFANAIRGGIKGNSKEKTFWFETLLCLRWHDERYVNNIEQLESYVQLKLIWSGNFKSISV